MDQSPSVARVSRRDDAARHAHGASAGRGLIADVRAFATEFRVAEDGATVFEQLLGLLQQVTVQGTKIHDANIVATMAACGVERILTHNVSDFMRFGRYLTVLPLAPTDDSNGEPWKGVDRLRAARCSNLPTPRRGTWRPSLLAVYSPHVGFRHTS